MHSDIVTVAGLRYRKAAWPRRIAARLIDIAFVVTICATGGKDLLILTVPFAMLYLLIGNAFLRGRSLGKRLTGLMVIDSRHGVPCSAIPELLRQRYLFFGSPLFLLFIAHDTSQGHFEKPELYVVLTRPLTEAEYQAASVVIPEKPATLDLAGMRRSLQQPSDEK